MTCMAHLWNATHHRQALRLSSGSYLCYLSYLCYRCYLSYLIIRYRPFYNYLIVCMSMTLCVVTLCVVQMAGDKVRPIMGCHLHILHLRFHNYLNMRMSVLVYVTQVVLHRWCDRTRCALTRALTSYHCTHTFPSVADCSDVRIHVRCTWW